MEKTWIVVADASRARLLVRTGKGGSLEEPEDLVHPEGRMPDRDIVSDRPGRSFDSAGEGRHAMEPRTDPGQEAAQEFAREVADVLEGHRAKGDFQRLILIAAPRFLGMLRDHLGKDTRRLVDGELDKDLVRADLEEILRHLPEAR